MSLKTSRCLLLLLFLLPLLLLSAATPAGARARSQSPTQSSPSAYWQYDAPGPLGLVEAADVDADGIDEFVVTTEDFSVVLLSASGRERWTYQTPDQTPIRQLITLNVDGDEDPGREILVATDTDLTLLSADGDVRWRKQMVPPTIPAVLLTSGGEEELMRRQRTIPASLAAFDQDGDGSDEILIALQSGLLQLYDDQGEWVWNFPEVIPAVEDPTPLLQVGDVNGDGQNEIVYGYFNRFSKLALLNREGRPIWERSLSGRITALSLVRFDSQRPPEIVLGNSFRDISGTQREQVRVYDGNGSQRWFRTPNRPVTSLAGVGLPEGRALVVGTAVGTLTAYNQHGTRLWHYRPDGSDRRVVAISPSPAGRENQPALAVTVAPDISSSRESADVLLVDHDGQVVQEYGSMSASGLTRLVDVNRDGISELQLVSFGTLALADPGTGARKNASAWEYRLSTAPRAMLAADIDLDGKDELLVGVSDGRLYLLESDVGAQASWIEILGGSVNHLAVVANAATGETLIVAAHTRRLVGATGRETLESAIRLLDADGQNVADQVAVPGVVAALAVGNVNRDSQAEILVGTENGWLIAYTLGLNELWRAQVEGGVEHIALLRDGGPGDVFVSTGTNRLYRFDGAGNGGVLSYYNLLEVDELLPVRAGDDGALRMLVAMGDGTVRALTRTGGEAWQWPIPGRPTMALPADDTFLIATDSSSLLHLDADGRRLWQQDDLGEITALYWGDLDGGGTRDLAVGNRAGNVYLFTSEQTRWDSVNLASSVFGLSGLRRQPDQPAELVAVTETGLVQLFEAKPNRPPLLIDPQPTVRAGQYNIRVTVVEEEGDLVNVTLETYDAGLGMWRAQGEEGVSGGGSVFFSIAPEEEEPVRYRFVYDDGTHRGVIEPPAGPVPLRINPFLNNIVGPLLVLLILFSAVLVARQTFSLDARTRRFYNRLKQRPRATLELVDAEYTRMDGAPNFLLNLANYARLDNKRALSNLVDGLFLLSTRPDAALPIVTGSLNDAREAEPLWRGLDVWRMTFNMGQAFLEAPSITELSLLRPQLSQLVQAQNRARRFSPGMAALLPVLTSLRDSERVDLAEDRMVYLHEATVLLRQIQQDLAYRPVQIENRLLGAIAARWLGLINAAVEALRGQAQPIVQLKTKRLVPDENGLTTIALEIRNTGRAEAENLVVIVEEDPAYAIHSVPQKVPVLSPGRVAQITATIEPRVSDRFRVAFTITYEDRTDRRRQLAFGDMVHLLPPVREFSPILNPYLPGTPLRRQSPVFYGREDLFEFIAQNAGQISRRNVLILVGQRRTGKTSLLLRLDQHLPDNLLPVYVDCQSLGVVPGMAALFHDMAWLIADALATRDIEVTVPEPAAWRDNPAGRFQRDFIPTVRALLPDDTTLMLVFDEFEAFENFVRDEILPPTFFTYMRHLMQHSDGLSFVFVGTRRLEEMTSDYWSVLFNIALYRQIGFLSEEASRRLIQEPVSPHIVYDDLALDKILRVTAGHPYFLQLVCYTLVNRANEMGTGYVTISEVNAALEEMLKLGEVHFAYIWQRSTHTERALLTAVAHMMDRDVPFHPADLVQYLEEYGFHLDPAEVTAGLNHLVDREIMREIATEGAALYELKIGLVGLWAAQNKSLSKLYESKNGAGNGRRQEVAGGEWQAAGSG